MVLNSNPLDNIRNTEDMKYVMKGGVLHDADTLDENEQQTESPDQTSPEPIELNLETPGIIAIRDLEKLEGMEAPPETEERPPEN